MARAYSLDLRKRVIEAIRGGLSTREAARRFAIGISTAGSWYRSWRATGSLEPGRQGAPKVSKLDPHEAFILALVETDDRDIRECPMKCVCERTFGWMIRWRRLVRDYEQRIDVSEAMIHVAMGSLLLRRIAH